MRYEYKIVVEADVYGDRNITPEEARARCDRIKAEMERYLRLRFACYDHVFQNVRVTAVQHDNDRDYTEEDARRHCGRTYLDAVREAFPGADVDTIERIMCPGRLFPDHPSGVKSVLLCPRADILNCRGCWREEIPDDEEAQNHDD